MSVLEGSISKVFAAGRPAQKLLTSFIAMACSACMLAAIFAACFLQAEVRAADSSSSLTKKVAGQYEARVVMVYDHECAVWCGQVKPILSELQSEYKTRVQFVALDTSSDQISASKITAKAIGASKFLNENADYAPVIGVFSARGKLLKELVGPKKKEIYADAIAKALSTQ